MTTRDGLITSEFDDAATFDDDVPLDEFGDYDARDIDDRPVDDADDDGEWDDDEEEGDELDVELELVVLGLSGTTIADADLIERAFARAIDAAGIDDPQGGARFSGPAGALGGSVAGRSVGAAFHTLAADDDQAQHARAEFEAAYIELATTEGLRAVPATADLIRRLRAAGVQVALTSEFSREMVNAALHALGWQHLADVTLTASEAGRGRPFPDLALTALLRTGASSVEGMVVVGGTASDIVAGVAAGAGLVVGVLSGDADEEILLDAGADAVIPSVADLPELLGFENHDARASGHVHGAASANVLR